MFLTYVINFLRNGTQLIKSLWLEGNNIGIKACTWFI